MAIGRFGYQRHGALGEANLRFFTRQSITEALAAAGLRPSPGRGPMGVTDGAAARPEVPVVVGRVDGRGLAAAPRALRGHLAPVEAEAEPSRSRTLPPPSTSRPPRSSVSP